MTKSQAAPGVPADLHAGGIYLLTIRGALAPQTSEQARKVHNETAGDPQGVAAARALGDLSHMVYMPLGTAAGKASTRELLILDVWTSMLGLGQFFSDARVQEGGGRIFAQRDPVVWKPAPGFTAYALPAPAGRADRFVGTIRGTVRSIDEAREILNGGVQRGLVQARMRGLVSHEMFVRAPMPGQPPSLEIFGVDIWHCADGMIEHYSDSEHSGYLKNVFTGPPAAAVWEHPAGEWVEW